MCEVTVVIPNYNGKEYLIPCLDALYQKTNAEICVIVVDNGSEDGSIERAKEKYPQAEYILLQKNFGFCRAVNIGIKKADTPYVILLNNDTKVRNGFVEQLLESIKSDQTIFSAEAKMIQYHNRSLIDSAGTFYTVLGWAYARGKDKPLDRYDKGGRCFAACAGAAIYRRDVFQEVGLFDERHFAYLEDVDIGYRARIHGYKNIYQPRAEVIHVGSAASGSRYNEFKTRYSSRNNVYMIYKNMPVFQLLLNLPFLCLGFAVKAAFFYKKGLGKEYVKGLREGISICQRSSKVPFEKKHLVNYLKIQAELWANSIKMLV